jgi:tetratricopeptide (TPR) repeat protein
MAVNWVEASGQDGIPATVLVDGTGRVIWVGHPSELDDGMIEDVMAGRFDTTKAAARHESRSRVWEALAGVLQAVSSNDWQTAQRQLDAAAKLLPEGSEDELLLPRFMILSGTKQDAAVREMAASVLAKPDMDAELLNGLAWHLVTSGAPAQLDYEIAEKLAIRANTVAWGEDPNILDTLARALFLRDKKAEAIAAQEKALALLPRDSKERERYQSTLDSYKAGRLPPAE